MIEIAMPTDGRPVAAGVALDRARSDGGLRLRIACALWQRDPQDDRTPSAAGHLGGYVYEMADRVAAVVEEIRREDAERIAAAIEARRCPSPELCKNCVCRREDAALVRTTTGEAVAEPAEPELSARFLWHWRPMSPQEVCDMTGIPEDEIRRLYGDTVLVKWDLRGPQEFRWGGPGPSPEIEETRAIDDRAMEGNDGDQP
ncbi:hypothetical protein DP939_02300 [Spongiactinospora rosea]|uniref:Uncharacterized protein n=1 Tax=Spongiactinospora rosea TaxID=2248750 RepID=A0A366M7X3_9ACTN|nr:hypothetical protein [Spongiactinospora rosea]RBQ21562.1 hypothetical protein DP939_02300 [Spongiactinospora rosea]